MEEVKVVQTRHVDASPELGDPKGVGYKGRKCLKTTEVQFNGVVFRFVGR
jgi:hypothetical protein